VPRSSVPPMNSDRGMSTSNRSRTPNNASTARYFPNTIWVTDTGEESSRLKVPLFNSRANRPMQSIGTISIMIMAAEPNWGTTRMAVTPGAFSRAASRGCNCRNSSRRIRNSQASRSMDTDIRIHASGDRNRLLSSRPAMLKIITGFPRLYAV